jgi:DNA transformation protein
MDRTAIEDFFAPFGQVQVRPMFGGHGVSREGTPFAIVVDGEFFLKCDDGIRAEFEAAGSQPFVYQGRSAPVQMSYWRVPDEALDDPDGLRRWCGLALAAARRAALRKRSRRRETR